jgi:ribosomal protein L29
VKSEVTASELRKKSNAELCAKKEELDRERFMARGVVATSGEKRQDAKARAMRKEIARILTILREREMSQVLRDPLL